MEAKQVWLFHAAPNKNNLYWYEDRPEKFFLEMAEKGDADVMTYGHIHRPYRKDIGGKVFINVGSVGKPKDGDLRACVAMITIGPLNVQVEFIRVSYAVERTAEAIIASGLPSCCAEKLKQGK